MTKDAAPTAVELVGQLASGAVSARTVADACLASIAERDGEIRAFAQISPDYVRAQADALDAHRKAGRPLGPLHGLPVGIKDIIDTMDYPTGNGTPLDEGRRPGKDAALVARLRAAGALVIGKTVTTEFAYQHPGPTRNPHNTAHTPGGSSQGSAAAVAAGMIPLAIGTQTVGSVIRPASFCGVTAFKPTHGTVSLAGVLPAAEPFDTAGAFAANIADVALLIGACQGHDPGDGRTRAVPHADLLAAAQAQPPFPPRLAIVGGPFWGDVSADVKSLFDEIAEFLGDRADRVDLPDVFANAFPAHLDMMKAHFVRNLRPYRERGESQMSERILEAMDEGEEVSAAKYLSALDWQEALRNGVLPIFDRYDAILTPAALGEAPEGLETTGDSRANALWSFLGMPAVALPAGRGGKGLPVGVQLVGRRQEDARLLRTAAWLERALKEAA